MYSVDDAITINLQTPSMSGKSRLVKKFEPRLHSHVKHTEYTERSRVPLLLVIL